jgi:hypothetical protein
VEGFSRVCVDGEVGDGKAGGGCGETRRGGGDAGQDIVSGAVGGGAGAIFGCDCGVGEGCAGRVKDRSFDAKAVGAALRVGGAQRRGEQDQSGGCPDPDCDSVLQVISSSAIRAITCSADCQESLMTNVMPG